MLNTNARLQSCLANEVCTLKLEVKLSGAEIELKQN